jgi:hypothetical protein
MGRGFLKNKRKRPKQDAGACFVDDCKVNGDETFHCKTCEAIGKTFSVQTCPWHREDAAAKIKKHALTAHPVNLLRAVVAGLNGDL